jgi:hypothetical protein
MAIRGKKPTATIVKLHQGTLRPGRANPEEPKPEGAVEKPKGLRGKASQLWDRFIGRAFWLTWADGPKALIWCHLQAEFERSPKDMQSARIAQLRALGSELGLDPSSRSRLGAALKPGGSPNGAEAEQEPKNGTGKYFA